MSQSMLSENSNLGSDIVGDPHLDGVIVSPICLETPLHPPEGAGKDKEEQFTLLAGTLT